MASTSNKNSMRSPVHVKKVSKPMLEKRRRVRINESLAQIKMLTPTHYSTCGRKNDRLEKAEILENTVEFIKQRGSHTRPTDRNQLGFSAGFLDCMTDIVGSLSGQQNEDFRLKLSAYLQSKFHANLIATTNVTEYCENEGTISNTVQTALQIDLQSQSLTMPVTSRVEESSKESDQKQSRSNVPCDARQFEAAPKPVHSGENRSQVIGWFLPMDTSARFPAGVARTVNWRP